MKENQVLKNLWLNKLILKNMYKIKFVTTTELFFTVKC